MLDFNIRYDGQRIAGLHPDDFIAGGSCDLEAGTIGKLEFELPATHPLAKKDSFSIEDPTKEIRLYDGDVELFRGWVKKSSLTLDMKLEVECEGMLVYLKNTIVRPYASKPNTDLPNGTTILSGDAFEWIVDQHNLNCGGDMMFVVGVNPHVGQVKASTDYKNTWDELNDAFCTGLDRYVHARSGPFDQRYIDLLDGGAGEGTQAVVLGENVVDMEISNESREIATVIIARGTTDDTAAQVEGDRPSRREFGLEEVDSTELPLDNSLLIIERDRAINQQMVDAYGWREEKRDYEASTPSELLQMVAADLNPENIEERAVTSITVNAVDLHMLNPDVQPLRLLDWTHVFVRADGMDEAVVEGEPSGRLIVDQWLPLSKIHIDLTDPSQTTYRFGDLPQTLTRKSALRMGMLRRGNGTLVRRTDGTPWDTDRVWDKAQDAWDHADDVGDDLRDELSDATDQWSQHLDEQFDTATQEWYNSLDEAQKENAQGREELLKHLDEVEGKWSDDLGRLDGDVSDLQGVVDQNHRELLDGIREAAEGAQETFFGTCGDSGSTRLVSAGSLTKPGGKTFSLAKGVVVDVLMTYTWNGACTLNIAGTGARSVVTNGTYIGIWQAGQVVRFLYDGSYWQACSTDIYGSSVTVGNPSQANFYTNGNSAELRIGPNSYWHAGVDGNRVGMLDKSHVDIGSTYVDIKNPDGGYLRMQSTSDYKCSISSSSGVLISNGKDASASSVASVLLPSSGYTALSGQRIIFTALSFYIGAQLIIIRSILVTCNGVSYVDVGPSVFGLFDLSGYCFAASNGDLGAQNLAVTGTSYNPKTRGITVHFSQATTGTMRLNIFGMPIPGYHQQDPGIEGPEIFDDPETSNDMEVE